MIYDRIKEFTTHLGISIPSLERNIKASNGTISRAIKNNTDIQTKWIHAILEKYPNLNANWLFLGEEPMLKGETISHRTKPITIEVLQTKVEHLENEIRLKDEIIALLKKQQS